MINPTFEKELHDQLGQLPSEQQRRVLEFARALAKSKISGIPGKNLLRFAGSIDSEDLKVIEQAIAEGCEKVNLDEW
jgi:hypothetical protein